MKKGIFTLLTILTASTLFAQFEQGRVLAGGNIGFSTQTHKEKNNTTTVKTGTTTSLNFGPRAGYFVINNLALGLGINANTSTDKSKTSDYKSTDSGIGVSPFVRYYLKPGIFFQGEVGFGSGKNKTTNINRITSTYKYNTFDWSLGAGYAWFLNNKVAIEPFIGYGADSSKPKGSDNKSIDSGLFINIGFQIYLDTKK